MVDACTRLNGTYILYVPTSSLLLSINDPLIEYILYTIQGTGIPLSWDAEDRHGTDNMVSCVFF